MRSAFAHPAVPGRGLSRPALGTCLLGLLLTSVLCGAVRKIEYDRAQAEFDQRAVVRVAAVTRAFAEATDAARAVNLFFRASEEITRAEFDSFAQPLVARHGYLQALVFQRFVGRAERAAFEAARAAFWPGFAIRQRIRTGEPALVRAGERDRYLVNDYVAPIVGNEVTFGYDAWSNAPQRVYTQRAIDSGEPAASPIIDLLQGGGARHGVLIILPVYRPGVRPLEARERRATVIGTTEVVIDVALLVGGTLESVRLLDDDNFALSLRGPDALGNPITAYQHGSLAAPDGWWERLLDGMNLRHVEAFEIAGSPWQVVVEEQPPALGAHMAELVAMALGLVLSFAAGGLVQQRVARTRRIEALVEQRTAALERATGALRLYERAMEASANPILLVDAEQPGYPIEYANPACERTFGRPARELAGQPLKLLAGLDAEQPAMEELRRALRQQREDHALLTLHTPDGAELIGDVYVAPVRRPDGQAGHFVVTVYDVTTAKRYEAELARHAHYDTLTGLANRALLADRIERAIANAGELPVWTVLLDFDHFKLINDTLGRRAGDEALRLLATRIKGAIRPADTAARVGGDDFVLVLVGYADERQAVARIQQVRDAVAEPIQLAGQRLVLNCSAGVAAYPADGLDADTLVKHAEIAMYRAKSGGRNGVQFYAPHMNAQAFDRLALESALRHALQDEQFELHFQPQVDLASGMVVGNEALIRWRHPLLGVVRPDRFIALAEETGLIVPIGAWVLQAACRQNRRWQRAGLGPLRIAVNLSARQFAEPDLVDTVARVLGETGLPPASLEIELTESMMMADADAAIHTMECLKRMGVKLSIDDFGTGYSSLQYLKRLPVDVLKIDRSFVHDIVGNPDGAALVDAIISLAHGLRMQVIAEGVETIEQLDYLRGCGCDEVQGHVFSRPQPATRVEALLRAGRVEPAASTA
ncbi:bifunctional diguanylate cyclase/phosphodiesterase [Telluria beijingensis]|uniref:bifunctional diguanylate cyclase/phosphodiesterase n=1 Tax=Telluria beijingensis TaxID=3068633 RepID=UPI0027957791|nr:EAL domain-containing protein [Massilia sp. REN29]